MAETDTEIPTDPPHLFVVAGDLVRLSSDDVLVPADESRTVTESLAGLLPDGVVGPPAGPGARRVDVPAGRVTGPFADRHGRRAWVVQTAGESATDDWIVSGVEEWLAAVAETDAEPLHGRARRLAALPLVGTGGGSAAGRRGDLLRELMPRLHAAARSYEIDVALVLSTASDHAAAQRVRSDLDLGRDLPAELLAAATGLAQRAVAGELAVFVGAGISGSAGMPLWRGLVVRLAEEAGFPAEEVEALADLSPQDAVSLIARRLGPDRLRRRVSELFADRPHALAHALLAGLPVREAVTTNFDTLYESASAGAGRRLSVLPDVVPTAGEPWLLKLHGDVGRPEGVVLTREEYLDYDAGRAALAGVVEALLLTRHVLFVGLSLVDDNVVRIAHSVGQVRPPDSGTVGTTLALRDDPLRRELWRAVLDHVAMTPQGTGAAVAARRLEIFLDALAAQATGPVGYLLDPAYAGLLTEAERDLADRLASIAGCDAAGTPAWGLVEDLLRRLGHS